MEVGGVSATPNSPPRVTRWRANSFIRTRNTKLEQAEGKDGEFCFGQCHWGCLSSAGRWTFKVCMSRENQNWNQGSVCCLHVGDTCIHKNALRWSRQKRSTERTEILRNISAWEFQPMSTSILGPHLQHIVSENTWECSVRRLEKQHSEKMRGKLTPHSCPVMYRL